MSRITIDITDRSHKKLKAIAALEGKSMREIVAELIDEQIEAYGKEEECLKSHVPNKETLKALTNVEKRKNLTKAKDAKELFKKLGF